MHDDGLVRQEDVVCTTRDVDEPHGRAGVAASSGVAGRYLARWVSCSTQTSVPPASPVQVKVEIASTGHLVAARVFTRLLETLLFDVSRTDLATFTVVAAVLLVVALAASLIPAVRAVRIDPMSALRA